MTEKFGDQVTADHAIVGTAEEGRYGETVAAIILDRHTNWTDAFPAQTKSAEDTKLALLEFFGPYAKPDVLKWYIRTELRNIQKHWTN